MRIARGLAVSAVAVGAAMIGATTYAATPDDMHYPLASVSYASVDITTKGVEYTHVNGVNNNGVMVGDYGDKKGQHGFIDNNGSITVINVKHAKRTKLTSINDAGTFTGVYWTASSSIAHGFIQTAAGKFTPLDVPAATSKTKRASWGTVPEGINNAGVVVGYYFTTTPNGAMCGDTECDRTANHGFVWTGEFTTYDAPGSVWLDNPRSGTKLFDINNHGVMVGSYVYLSGDPDPVGVTPGFKVDASGANFSTYIDPGFPANWCWETSPATINDLSTVGGGTLGACGGPEGSVRRLEWLLPAGDTSFASATEVSYPDSTNTEVGDVNNSGVVVGTSTDASGHDHGFIATPQ